MSCILFPSSFVNSDQIWTLSWIYGLFNILGDRVCNLVQASSTHLNLFW
jgi:hypothetical protein